MLKRRIIETGLCPQRIGIPASVRAFFAQVRQNGLTNESRVGIRLMFMANPFQYTRKAFMGIKMSLRRRLSLKQEKLTGGREMKTLLQKLEHPMPPKDTATLTGFKVEV